MNNIKIDASNEKKVFEPATIEIIMFETNDVITTSPIMLPPDEFNVQ